MLGIAHLHPLRSRHRANMRAWHCTAKQIGNRSHGHTPLRAVLTCGRGCHDVLGFVPLDVELRQLDRAVDLDRLASLPHVADVTGGVPDCSDSGRKGSPSVTEGPALAESLRRNRFAVGASL